MNVVSSRVRERRDQLGWWYDLLRTAVLRVDSSDECLFAVDGTVSADAVVRAAELFEIPLLQVSFAERVSSASVAEWLADCRPSSEPSIAERGHATVSPPLDNKSTSRTDLPCGIVWHFQQLLGVWSCVAERVDTFIRRFNSGCRRRPVRRR